MIKETNTDILCDVTTGNAHSVVLVPCNAKGWMGTGLSARVAKKWPQSFKTYHEHCAWFKDGHEAEIMGTFVPVQVSDNIIICNAIVQQSVGKSSLAMDIEAWKKVCRKIAYQTDYVNRKLHKCWTIHAPMKVCLDADGQKNEVYQAFQDSFGNSEKLADLVLHEA